MTTTSPSLMAELDNPFWRFSLSVYQNESVKTSCIAFQDNYKVNVNILLLCCWLAYAVDEVTESDIMHCFQVVDNWDNNVTQLLRRTRRWIKALEKKEPWVEEFGQQLLIDEIVSETYQQYQLYCCFQERMKKKPSKNEEKAGAYISILFTNMGLLMDKDLIDDIKLFVELVFARVK